MKYHLLLFLSLGIFLASCKSEQEKARDRMCENIKESWELLDLASTQKEIYLSVPLEFQLGCTINEFESHCDTLVKEIGGENHYFTMNSGYSGVIDTYLNTNVFGGAEKKVMIPHDNYMNPKIKNINKISFRFIEFQNNRELDGGWETFRDYVSSKFDESWDTVDFDLDDVNGKYSLSPNYYKYWIRGNMAVEFNYNWRYSYPTLTFYNVSKYGANNIKVSIPTKDEDDGYYRHEQFDEEKMKEERYKQWNSAYREYLRRYGK